jgi:hypothetical protein
MNFVLFHSLVFRDMLGAERMVFAEDYAYAQQEYGDENHTARDCYYAPE